MLTITTVHLAVEIEIDKVQSYTHMSRMWMSPLNLWTLHFKAHLLCGMCERDLFNGTLHIWVEHSSGIVLDFAFDEHFNVCACATHPFSSKLTFPLPSTR